MANSDSAEQEPRGATLTERLAHSVERYIENEDNDTLRDHQNTVFADILNFFREGHHKGYINLPTGTGKTVLFVELAKALLNTADGEKSLTYSLSLQPKILSGRLSAPQAVMALVGLLLEPIVVDEFSLVSGSI